MAMDLSRVPARIFSDSEMTLFRLDGADIVLAAAGERQELARSVRRRGWRSFRWCPPAGKKDGRRLMLVFSQEA